MPIIVKSVANFNKKEAKDVLFCSTFEVDQGSQKSYGYLVKNRPIVEEDYTESTITLNHSLPITMMELKDCLARDWGVDRRLSAARLNANLYE